MLFEDYVCYTVNKFFNFSNKCLKKSTICYATDH